MKKKFVKKTIHNNLQVKKMPVDIFYEGNSASKMMDFREKLWKTQKGFFEGI